MIFQKLLQINDQLNTDYEKEHKGNTILFMEMKQSGIHLFQYLSSMDQHWEQWNQNVSIIKGKLIGKEIIYPMIDVLQEIHHDLDHEDNKELKQFLLSYTYDNIITICNADILQKNIAAVQLILSIHKPTILVIRKDKRDHKKINIALLSELLHIKVIECEKPDELEILLKMIKNQDIFLIPHTNYFNEEKPYSREEKEHLWNECFKIAHNDKTKMKLMLVAFMIAVVIIVMIYIL